MSYLETVQHLDDDAEGLEQAYRKAVETGQTDAFRQAIDDSHSSAPANLLYAAWFHRLKYAADEVRRHVIDWALVVPLAVANALLFWWLSQDRYMVKIRRFMAPDRDYLPLIVIMASSIAAVILLLYLSKVGGKRWRLSILIALLLLAASGYVLLTYVQTGTLPFQQQYLTLMVLHLPLLAWAGLGFALLAKHQDSTNRFAFLIKSLEVAIVGGLFVIAGGLFTAITMGLFQALNVDVPELVQRLFIAGGAGMIVVVATAIIYNPILPPAEQAHDQGLSKIVALLTRVMLPLALVVLIVYLAFVPFNFRAPFDNRDVLIVYNGMLFAVIALLAAATPVHAKDLPPRLGPWLRRGIIAVAALALLVGVYALSAISYRTAMDRLTPNRLSFIGWSVINIGLLALVIVYQVRSPKDGWIYGLHKAYSIGTVAYLIWTVVIIAAVPWLFGIDQGSVENLPVRVQELIYEKPDPLLLKCYDSPHIYRLERGTKRWIDSIDTFNDRGYNWDDVHMVTCDDLLHVPDGQPIPADAGSPPQP